MCGTRNAMPGAGRVAHQLWRTHRAGLGEDCGLLRGRDPTRKTWPAGQLSR